MLHGVFVALGVRAHWQWFLGGVCAELRGLAGCVHHHSTPDAARWRVVPDPGLFADLPHEHGLCAPVRDRCLGRRLQRNHAGVHQEARRVFHGEFVSLPSRPLFRKGG